MSANWTPESWKSHEGIQMPDYADKAALAATEARLGRFPPLVFAGEARNLTADLAKVSRGEAFLLQGGDCAESFADDLDLCGNHWSYCFDRFAQQSRYFE